MPPRGYLEGSLSVTYIPDKIKFILWGKSAGRCQYCNHPIYLDDFTQAEFNSSYIAHIVADQPNGPRGHATESERLKADISNLMLLCDVHHRLIDREDVTGHSVDRLRKMKAEHEDRVSTLTEQPSRKSHIVLYGARIAQNDSPLSWSHAHTAIIPKRYPADRKAIEMGFQNSSFADHEPAFWAAERTNLNRNFERLVKRPITDGHIEHLSVCAIAPQPLLIELGRLISDLRHADIYQLQREPTTWRWVSDDDGIEFKLSPPPHEKKKNVALNVSLSANVDNTRIHDVLGDDTSVWMLTIEQPNNNFLKSPKTLAKFRVAARTALNAIKTEHGQDTVLNVFPAMPVATAVEFGRVWQPKADMKMVIYDQNRTKGGFIETLTIEDKDYSQGV